jgi:hypothetical protein
MKLDVSRPFVPSPVPTRVNDMDQRDWNARQWRELGDYVLRLEQRLQALGRFIIDEMTFAGHGWMNRQTSLGVTIDTTWRRLVFQSVTPNGKRVSFSAANGSFTVETVGFWEITLNVSLAHNEDTAKSRGVEFRVVDAAAPGVAVISGIAPVARNAGVTRFGTQWLLDATAGGGLTYYFEYKAVTGDVFTGASFSAGNVTVFNVGEWPSDTPLPAVAGFM